MSFTLSQLCEIFTAKPANLARSSFCISYWILYKKHCEVPQIFFGWRRILFKPALSSLAKIPSSFESAELSPLSPVWLLLLWVWTEHPEQTPRTTVLQLLRGLRLEIPPGTEHSATRQKLLIKSTCSSPPQPVSSKADIPPPKEKQEEHLCSSSSYT